MHVNPAEFEVTLLLGGVQNPLRGPENVFDFDFSEPMLTYFWSGGPSLLQVDTLDHRLLR